MPWVAAQASLYHRLETGDRSLVTFSNAIVAFYNYAAHQGQIPSRRNARGEDQMPKMIFVNLPVADLAVARAFYEAIGATNEPRFTDETAACMVISDTIFVMLLTHAKFAQFTPKKIADAHATSEVLIAISEDSREAVDDITEKALAAGGREARERQDYGFMYSRSFEDPDGHIWEPNWMDLGAALAAMPHSEPATA
ncbi:MAG: VOC family protein [Allosphingosinicella sp.]